MSVHDLHYAGMDAHCWIPPADVHPDEWNDALWEHIVEHLRHGGRDEHRAVHLELMPGPQHWPEPAIRSVDELGEVLADARAGSLPPAGHWSAELDYASERAPEGHRP